MKTILKKSVACLLSLVLLCAFVPMQGMAQGGGVAHVGTASTSSASRPAASQAAGILGLSSRELDELKEAIFNTAYNYGRVCDVTRFQIPYNIQTRESISGLISDTMPELFNVNNWMFYEDGRTGYMGKIEFYQYEYSQSEYAQMMSRCREVTEYLTYDLVDSNLTEAKKALILHDRLATWVDYDNAAFVANDIPYIDHTMYGALWNNVAVCDGYAEAYQYLLRAVGIDSYVCRSNDMYHAWNIVYVEGQYYHVDVTYDDPVWDVTGRVNHDYFLLSSAALYAKETHKYNDYDTTPTDTKFDSGWPWFNSYTAHQLFGERIYYIDNEREMLCYWEGKTLYDVLSVEDTWWISATRYYTDNYSRLSADEHYLYYSLAKSVHRYDPQTGKSEPLHYPDFSNRPYHNIYGMEVGFNAVYCDITDNPRFDANTKAERQEGARYRDTEVMYVLIEDSPARTTYCVGESLNTSGLTIKARKSDGSAVFLEEGFTVEGYNPNLAGNQVVTVRYGGHTATFTVTVIGESNLLAGDVDGNGKIDSTDARLVLQLAVGKIQQNAIIYAAADVDGNGKVDSTDARLILQYAVGKIKTFPNKK